MSEIAPTGLQQFSDLDDLRERFVENTPEASADDVQRFKTLCNDEIDAILSLILHALLLKKDLQNNGNKYSNTYSQALSTYPFSPADRAA